MDAVIATSARSGAFLDVPHTVVMHGIDLDRFVPHAPDDGPLRRRRPAGGRHAIGCFGRIRHQKGTDLFVDAMIALLPEFPDWTAIVTGRVTPEHRISPTSLKAGCATPASSDRILFLGEVPDIKPWYRRCRSTSRPRATKVSA